MDQAIFLASKRVLGTLSLSSENSLFIQLDQNNIYLVHSVFLLSVVDPFVSQIPVWHLLHVLNGVKTGLLFLINYHRGTHHKSKAAGTGATSCFNEAAECSSTYCGCTELLPVVNVSQERPDHQVCIFNPFNTRCCTITDWLLTGSKVWPINIFPLKYKQFAIQR